MLLKLIIKVSTPSLVGLGATLKLSLEVNGKVTTCCKGGSPPTHGLMFCGSITVKGDIGWGKVGKPPMDIMPSGGPATTVPNTSKNSGSLTIPTNGEEEPWKNTFDIAVTAYGYIKVGVGVAGWKGTGEVGGWSLSKGFYWEPKGKSEFVARESCARMALVLQGTGQGCVGPSCRRPF